MIYTPWPYSARVVERMADSSLDTALPPREARSPGLHASTLLKMLHPVESAITGEELKVYGLLGLAFEDRAERALISLSAEPDWPWECYRPGEVSCDEVACSPDILMLHKEDGELQEMSLKATWKSPKDAPTGAKFNYYRDQSLTYATPLDTLRGVLLVYFVNGEYKKYNRGEIAKPPIPTVRGWQMEWTLQERGEMWQAIQNLKREHLHV